jgi:microcystin-dependent protein
MATKTQVNTDSAQTLSNKTLTTPILNSATCGADPTTPLGVCTKQYAEGLLVSVLPTGVMLPYGGASPPTGFLLCDGSNVSRTTYAALFAVLSTFYGVGDGSTTFTLPDKRGRTSIGAGTGPGLTARTRGNKIGTENETAPLPAHTHSYATVQNVGGGGFLAGGGEKPSTSSTTGSAGPGGTHNNMQPSEVDLWIIKT